MCYTFHVECAALDLNQKCRSHDFTDRCDTNSAHRRVLVGRVRFELTMFTARVRVLQTPCFSLLHTYRESR